MIPKHDAPESGVSPRIRSAPPTQIIHVRVRIHVREAHHPTVTTVKKKKKKTVGEGGGGGGAGGGGGGDNPEQKYENEKKLC